jgi:hypothetical protein
MLICDLIAVLSMPDTLEITDVHIFKLELRPDERYAIESKAYYLNGCTCLSQFCRKKLPSSKKKKKKNKTSRQQ